LHKYYFLKHLNKESSKNWGLFNYT
jgi:hypothetical protein